jgi:uncharacterized protein Yka (UPF0111/DUF47 family)
MITIELTEDEALNIQSVLAVFDYAALSSHADDVEAYENEADDIAAKLNLALKGYGSLWF